MARLMKGSAPVILLIEDDPRFTTLLSTTLENLDFAVLTAPEGESGLNIIRGGQVSLLILDLGLPDIDGQVVIQRLRSFSKLPVIVLSARDQESEITLALDNGADDYLCKPFRTAELISRINALLRRAALAPEKPPGCIRTGELRIDLDKRQVTLAGREIHLTPIEYKLLSVLAQNLGFVVTHRQLLEKVWGAAYVEHNHYPRIYMGHLRHKLETNPARPRYLLTETGVGYRLGDGETG